MSTTWVTNPLVCQCSDDDSEDHRTGEVLTGVPKRQTWWRVPAAAAIVTSQLRRPPQGVYRRIVFASGASDLVKQAERDGERDCDGQDHVGQRARPCRVPPEDGEDLSSGRAGCRRLDGHPASSLPLWGLAARLGKGEWLGTTTTTNLPNLEDRLAMGTARRLPFHSVRYHSRMLRLDLNAYCRCISDSGH